MKILVFSPFAFYSVHALPEALVADSLIYHGSDVITVNCDGLLNKGCLSMPSEILSDVNARNDICNQCKKNRDAINAEFGFNPIFLDDFVKKLVEKKKK